MEDLGGSPEIQDSVKAFEKEVLSQLTESGVTDYIADTVAAKDVLLIGLGTAFVIGFIYLILLRWIVGPIVWISIFLTIASLGAGGYFCFEKGNALPETDKYKLHYTYGSYAIWGICGLFLICLCCNCRNIRIGIAVMKTTAAFIKDTPQVFLLPPICGVLVFIWLIVWMITAAYIGSVGTPAPDETFPMLTTIKWEENTRYAILYSLFGYLWINAFLISSLMFVIAATCGQWYFSCNSDADGSGSVIKRDRKSVV